MEMTRDAVELAPLDAQEIDDVPFDFSKGMQPDETIDSVQIEVEVEEGDDLLAQQMATRSPVIGSRHPLTGAFTPSPTGRVVLQRFSALNRAPGNLYCLRCLVTLNSGRQLVCAAHIRVKRL